MEGKKSDFDKLVKSDFFPSSPLAEIFFRSRGESYPLKNSKLDRLAEGVFYPATMTKEFYSPTNDFSQSLILELPNGCHYRVIGRNFYPNYGKFGSRVYNLGYENISILQAVLIFQEKSSFSLI